MVTAAVWVGCGLILQVDLELVAACDTSCHSLQGASARSLGRDSATASGGVRYILALHPKSSICPACCCTVAAAGP
mgnify:CR=1 FL=1